MFVATLNLASTRNRAMREYAARRGWIIALMAREVNSGAAKRLLRHRILDAAARFLPLIRARLSACYSFVGI